VRDDFLARAINDAAAGTAERHHYFSELARKANDRVQELDRLLDETFWHELADDIT
jgi:hypothetical protein